MKWVCEFCTFINDPGPKRICVVCFKESRSPNVGGAGDTTKGKGMHKAVGMVMGDVHKGTSKMPAAELEAKRRYEQWHREGSSMIQELKKCENSNYNISQFSLSLKPAAEFGMSNFDWLQDYWDMFKENIISQAQIQGTNILRGLTVQELEIALTESRDADQALELCKEKRRNMIASFPDREEKDIIDLICRCRGDDDAILRKMNQSVMDEVCAMINAGVETHPLLDEQFLAYVKDDTIDKEVRLRAILVEGKLRHWVQAENVLDLIDDENLDLSMASLQDVVLAVKTCNMDMDLCRTCLQQECETCFAIMPMNKIRSLVHCQCKICEECMVENFRLMVRDRDVQYMICPVCAMPDLQNEATAASHFQILDLMLKNILDPSAYELFQRKLRDWNLRKEPNFRWCAHCECGFIFNYENGQLKMVCPECRQSTCFNCKAKWEPQHTGLSCEEFRQWKHENDPEFQAAGLARYLEDNGIDCPGCKYSYALARGGCMHFRCTQCGYEFCSGCNQPFKKGEACRLLKKCSKSGLHCHHPRDCLYYMRDRDVGELQELLDDYEIDYEVDPPTLSDRNVHVCHVMEQKETPDGLKDEPCGKDVIDGEAGLCTIHYKEYLVVLIHTNKVDPISIMDTEDLCRQLERVEKPIPPKYNKETSDAYMHRLREHVEAVVPLPDGVPRMRNSQTLQN